MSGTETSQALMSGQLPKERGAGLVSVAADLVRLVAKQKKLSGSSFDACQNLKDALDRLQVAILSPTTSVEARKLLLAEFQQQVLALFETLSVREKELKAAITKYTKSGENCFDPQISQLCNVQPLEKTLLERAIGEHLYREGHFDIADSFARESGQRFEDTYRLPFRDLYAILNDIRHGTLEPAILWTQRVSSWIERSSDSQDGASESSAAQRMQDSTYIPHSATPSVPTNAGRQALAEKLRELEFKLHRLRFVNYLQERRLPEALAYARQHFARFQRSQTKEIQQLMGCFAFVSRIAKSPYASFFTSALSDDAEQSFRRCFWAHLDLSEESPLYSVVACGTIALPVLMRATRLLATRESWTQREELPVEIDLGKKYKYHSIFVCPVSREQSTPTNPPYLLPCGHVLCKETVNRLPRGNTRFKCPYCPSEQQVAACRQINF